jgi:hypothetical protein
MRVRDVVGAAVAALTDERLRVRAADFPRGAHALDAPGLFAWWTDERGAEELSAGLDAPVPPGLLHVGQTLIGTGSATLRERVLRVHLGGTIRSSTFRWSLAAVLRHPLGLDVVGPRKLARSSEAALTTWMQTRLSVATYAFSDRVLLRSVEDGVLRALDPLFELEGRDPTPVRRRLRELRSSLAAHVAVDG